MRLLVLLGMLMLGAHAACDTPANPAAPLAFRIDEGRNINSFFQQGPVAAHLLLRSGNEPRILVAFPAGNSGVGLWFEKTAEPVSWKLLQPPRPLSMLGSRRRALRGIEFEVAVDTRELRPRAAVLSSVRVLRDYELTGKAPEEVLVEARERTGRISWSRNRLDGAAGYRLVITARDGARLSRDRWIARPGRTLRLKVRALSGEMPLTPLRGVLTAQAGGDARAREVLAFLSYQEKFLAGSWRFDTYFGRDTLMSALLLAPVLEPEAAESAISSVLERLARDGEVAHEEDIGEFAVLRNAREGRGRVSTPIYDYGMVDDDFMLAPLAARWLLDDARGRARARAFLAGRDARGEHRGAALARNIAWVVERSAAFADRPLAANLVGIKAGRMTGNWRDSEQGLGGGRYPYDVNAALVPAALQAAARLYESGLLHDFLGPAQLQALARARPQAQAWSLHAPGLFAVDVDATKARTEITSYARQVGVDPAPAVQALGDEPLRFHALSLDEQGRPIPILNSDEGFRLLLTDPEPGELQRSVAAIMRPFPAGLMTGAGLLVANPALTGEDLRREFTRFAYHGTVVWSWQQALLAAGLEHQLRRPLPEPTRAMLARARADLWTVIQQNRAMRTSELWSWSWSGGRYHAEPFGRPGADVDESNAAQLWSTVYLGLKAPD
ncbi:MAG TPA: hypothetical protein VFS13_15680 [Steroidobacteraceae bacterium]|nr:hypothetical protein [Steroidobacteraceae bacterium]